jgi:RNA polymerase sigma-70 factor (ECF subfamily)
LLELFILLSFQKWHDSNEEKQLIMEIAAENQKAFFTLYERYKSLLYTVIIKIVKNVEDAEEILQEIFMTVWNKSKSFDYEKGSVYVWLLTLSRNRAIDKIRSKAYRNQKIQSDIEDYAYMLPLNELNGLDLTVLKEKAKFIEEALDSLPEDQSILLRLAYFEGYTQSELAEKLQIPLGTIKTRMRLAMLKLKQSILKDLFS